MNLQEFKESLPSNFNVLIRNINDCPSKKSDSGNGYYIVSDVWGTCFHRISTKKYRFVVKYTNNRSYTKIPKTAIQNTRHCLVNFINQAFEIIVPENERFRVVGIHEPVKHVSKDYKTQSFIVYARCDFEIKIIDNTELSGGLWIKTKNNEYIRPEQLLSVYPVHYICPF